MVDGNLPRVFFGSFGSFGISTSKEDTIYTFPLIRRKKCGGGRHFVSLPYNAFSLVLAWLFNNQAFL
jgi:hypothetical protein